MISIVDVTDRVSHITGTHTVACTESVKQRAQKREIVKRTRMQYRSAATILTTTTAYQNFTCDIQYCGWNYVIIIKTGLCPLSIQLILARNPYRIEPNNCYVCSAYALGLIALVCLPFCVVLCGLDNTFIH